MKNQIKKDINFDLKLKEWKTLKQQGNQNFIISNAQKGGAVTIQGIKDQKCEIERQRNNKEHYKVLSTA